MSETFVLHAGGVPVTCTYKRVKNINLRCGADGTVRMSIPHGCPASVAEAFLSSRSDWVRRAAGRRRERLEAEDGTGGVTRLWGEELPVTVVPDTLPRGRARASVTGDGVVVELGAGQQATAGIVGAALESLRKREVERELEELVPCVEAEVGARASSWSVRRMRTRWGSCTPSSGRIRLSSSLAEHPRECLSYVAVHECCHLIEPSHNERFHRLMDEHCPDWRRVRALLNGRGA